MSRNRYRGRRTVKAGPSDAQILQGTLADVSAQSISDNEQYWWIYRKHPWVRSIVTLIANAVSAEGYDIVPVDDKDEVDDNDPRLELIHEFFRVAFIGKFNTFRKTMNVTVCDLQTYGPAYWRKKYGQQDGQRTLVALERLNARYMIPHLNDDRTEIDHYTLIPSKAQVDGAVAQMAQQLSSINGNKGEEIPADEIIMFGVGEGGDDVMPAPSPLEALDLTVTMDINIRKHRNMFFENGAQLGNVLIGKNVTEEQAQYAQKKLNLMHVGPRRSWKNISLMGDWDIKSLMQQGKNDADFIKGTQIVIEEIMAVYKVPPGKLRDVAGSMGQAGKGEDDETFEQECILPIEESFYETLTLEILQKEFEIDDLRLVPARRNKLRRDLFESAALMVKFGASGNQALDMVGLPKSDAPGMDSPLFLGATKGDVAGDMPVNPANQMAEAEAATGGGASTGTVTSNAEQKKAPANTTLEKKKPGAAKGAKGKDPWY